MQSKKMHTLCNPVRLSMIFLYQNCVVVFFAVAAAMCWFPCLHVVCCFYYSDEFIRQDSALVILWQGPVSSTWQFGQQRFYKIHNLQWFINSWSVYIHIMENTQGDVTKYLVSVSTTVPLCFVPGKPQWLTDVWHCGEPSAPPSGDLSSGTLR